MKILAIETSCDETAIAIAEFSGSHAKPQIRILSNMVSSQAKLHAKFGGVVPNLAKREHQKNLVPVLLQSLKEAGLTAKNVKSGRWNIDKIKKGQHSTFHVLHSILEREPELFARIEERLLPLKTPKIDAIAVTYGPGLAPALWVGVNFAKALALIWDKPIIPVNHMAGHLYSALLDSGMWKVEGRTKKPPPTFYTLHSIRFPAIALLVSGGHTELILMKGYGKYKIIGETLDDAAGEAFDKVARMLGLKYPGGPAISALAEMEFKQFKRLNVQLPRPMINSKDYNFSFSGLKTAVLYLLQDRPELKKNKIGKAAVAREFQNAVVDVLVSKTIRATKEFKVKTILLGGGVAANKLLRLRLEKEIASLIPNSLFLIPDLSLTGDNALMIALAANFQWASLAPKGRAAYFQKNKKTKNLQEISAHANLRLGSKN